MQEASTRLTRPHGQTGLVDSDRRALMRRIFNATGLTIGVFALLQFSSGNLLFASFEVLACLGLLAAGRGIQRAQKVERWILLYLLPTYSFIIYISLMRHASASAFVWVYLIPILSYLMLGMRRGMLLALPFMLLALLLYYLRNPLPQHPQEWIDAGNAVLCGALILVFVHLYETRRASAFAELIHQTQTDTLTGADSRSHFRQELLRALNEADRSQAPLTVALMDIDHFKRVNDRYGHDAGDHALRHICELLYQRLRSTDNLGRLGGEEFGLLLRNTEAADGQQLLDALRRLIAEHPLYYKGQSIELSVTIGMAEWPHDGRTPDELYRCADQRLYRGKEDGRNRVVSNSAVGLADGA